MAAVQLMCARLGMVTGRGLASVIRRHYSRRVLWGACALLVVANVVNIGADLGGMAEVTEMVTGVKAYVWTPLYAAFIVSLLFWSSYRRIARSSSGSPSCCSPTSWPRSSPAPTGERCCGPRFVPHVEWSNGYLAIFVGILGTTISPYLFFWQAAQEVEEDRAAGRRTVRQRRGATDAELRRIARRTC